MKIAYLITTYNNPEHLNKLIHSINNKYVDIYIHIDKKSKTEYSIPKQKNIHVLRNNINVYWGSYTFNDAVMLMINKAKKKREYDYYCLISGTDYPIKSNNYILKFFNKNKGKEFVNIIKMPEQDKSFDRLDYYHISTIDRNKAPLNSVKRLINILIKKLNIKRSYPKEYSHFIKYGGSNWWALTGECIDYICEFEKKNSNFKKFYQNTLIPEEMYFHTIIGNSPFINRVANAIVYTDWNKKHKSLPALINDDHLKIFKKEKLKLYGIDNTSILFARKFDDSKSNLITKIDKIRKTYE